MSHLVIRALICSPNSVDLAVLLIGNNQLQLTNLFAEYLGKITFEPTEVHASVISENAKNKEVRSLIQTAYFDDIEVLIASDATPNTPIEELATNPNIQVFLDSTIKGVLTNAYLDELLNQFNDKDEKSPWILRTQQEAPKTGEYFMAFDEVNKVILHTMHWDGEEFMTEYESWSGHFEMWTQATKSPDMYD